MVLICNNNILTIETFHKNRCAEKAAIQHIIINESKYDEKYKERPLKEQQPQLSVSYIESTKDFQIKEKKSIPIPNSRRS